MAEHTSSLLRSGKKADLRSCYLKKREALSSNQHATLSQQICQNILSILPDSPIGIHLFLPIARFHEVNLLPLLSPLWRKGHSLYVPRVTKGVLAHVEIRPDTIIKENDWGIPEPLPSYPAVSQEEITQIKWVLTPLLVCDAEGYRVGYGGGFYDQFFHDYPHVQKVGVGFFSPILKIEDTYIGDIRLDQYISPQKITAFNAQK